jgi:hypothetical protein
MGMPVLEPPTPAVQQHWRALYKAAIWEENREILPSRINEAKAALARRARELFAMANNTEECEAVDRAMNTLHALSYCLKLETRSKVGPSTAFVR